MAKIAISRSVLRNSGILILDEPSSALDPKSEYEMFEKMKMLMRDKMSIMITHRFSNVRIVDQIFVMQEGKVVEFGSHEDLMLKKGIYYNCIVYRRIIINNFQRFHIHSIFI